LSAEAVDGMTDSVKALASETGRGPKELADAMFFITSAGLRGKVALDTLEASAKAAAVGLGDTATIADLATSALNAYGSDVLSAGDATDVLVAAVREGKLEADELAGAMGRVLPVSSQMGVEFHEVGAAFAAMSRTGTGANEAATQLRSIMVTLLKPTKQAEEALADMGLSSEGLRTQMKDKGLLSTLQTLKDKFDGNSAATAEVFGNVRALIGVFDLMGANVETTEQIFANMTDTTGMLDEAFKVTSETAAFKFQQAMAEAKKMLVDFGQAIIPVVVTMLEGIQSIVGAFAAMPVPLKLAAGAMAAFVVASGPIGQIAIAIGGIAYLIGRMGRESGDAKALQESLTDEFIRAGDPAATMNDRMIELAASITGVGDAADGAVNPVGDLVGSATVFEEIAKRGLIPAVDDLGVSLDLMAEVASSGTDVFGEMRRQIDYGADPIKELDRRLVGATGAELDLITAMKEGIETKKIEKDELKDLLDALDKTADGFDNHRAAIEKDAKAFMESAASTELLTAAGYDSLRMLAVWEEQGLSFAEQQASIELMTLRLTDSMNDSVPAIDGITDSMDDSVPSIDDMIEALDESAGAAESLRTEFEKLMSSITFDGEAVNNVKLLLLDIDDVIEDMAEKALPEIGQAFFDFSEEAAGTLGDLLVSGKELGGPEMTMSAAAFIGQLEKIHEKSKLPAEELFKVVEMLERMSGLEVPISIKVDMYSNALGIDPEVLAEQITQIDFGAFAGATGGIVTQPTMALIGEAGPEAVVPLNQAPGASPLSGGMGGMGVTNITINMPVGSSGDDIIRSLRNNERLNGSIPITPMAGVG